MLVNSLYKNFISFSEDKRKQLELVIRTSCILFLITKDDYLLLILCKNNYTKSIIQVNYGVAQHLITTYNYVANNFTLL